MTRTRQDVEYDRAQLEQPALQRMRAELALRGVGFTWEWKGARLFAKLKGRRGDGPGHQGSAWVMTLLEPSYPYAVIEGGGNLPDGKHWIAIVWLNAPEAEARRREEQHAHLDPTPDQDVEGRRCPHDGGYCRGRPSRLVGIRPQPCAPDDCRREQEGTNLRRPYKGYPLPGHVYPTTGTREHS